MRPEDRETARRQLDNRWKSLMNLDSLSRPSRGWIRAIREALGMTTAQFGKRVGVSQPRAVAIERAEANGAITINSLEKAANALDCRLVYALIPRKPLNEFIADRARRMAKQQLLSTSHSMALEAQEVDGADQNEQFKRLVQRLIDKAGSALWEGDV